MIEIIPVHGIGEIFPGDDLAFLLREAFSTSNTTVNYGDIIVITQKIISKSEDRFVDLRKVQPGTQALAVAKQTGKDPRLVELVLRESSDIVRAVPGVLITRHRLGFVMANAGVDKSNLGPGRENQVLLLPKNPDASAAQLSKQLADALGVRIGVVVSDSFGRPWRHGVVNVALGAYGAPSLADFRGARDRDGRIMEVTQVAVADLIASAAGLAAGEGAESVPVVIVRGFKSAGNGSPAAVLIRPAKEDLFR